MMGWRFQLPASVKIFWQDHVLVYIQRLQPSEQRTLKWGVLGLVVVVVVFGMVLPLRDAKQSLQLNVKVFAKDAAQAQSLAARLQSQSVPTFTGDAMSTLDALAKEHDVRQFLTHIRPQPREGNQKYFIFQLRDVPFVDALKMLQAVQSTGLQFTELKLQRATKDGVVHVKAVVMHG